MNLNDFLAAALAVFVLMNIASFFAIRLKRNDIADVVWGPGFLISGLVLLIFKFLTDQNFVLNIRIIFALMMVGIWSLRLFLHIGLRNLRKTEEDARYVKMRNGWGDQWKIKSYTHVFILQGLLMLLIDLSVFIIICSPAVEMSFLSYSGIAIWVFGFLIESIADAQLASFTKDPSLKGKIMDQGLWSWSRHPNYFGEVVQWWGVFFMTIELPQVWLSLVSPLLITFLILKVSGVTMLEEQMKNRPGFKEYQKRTSKFILFPPRD